MHRTTGTPSGSRELILDVVMPAHTETIRWSGPTTGSEFGEQRVDVLRLDRQDERARGCGRLGDVQRLHAVGVGEIAGAFGVLLADDDVGRVALAAQQPAEQGLADLAAAEQADGVHSCQPFDTRERAKNTMFAGRSARRRIKYPYHSAP